MTVVGVALLWRSRQRRLGRLAPRAIQAVAGSRIDRPPSVAQIATLAVVVLFSTTIASNWTQDVPARYGARHPGRTHSWLYPPINTAPPTRP